MGLAIGGGVGLYTCLVGWSASESDTGAAVPGCALVVGVMGAGIGAGVDAMFRRTRVIYSRSGSAERVAVSPLVARDRKGILVSVGF